MCGRSLCGKKGGCGLMDRKFAHLCIRGTSGMLNFDNTIRFLKWYAHVSNDNLIIIFRRSPLLIGLSKKNSEKLQHIQIPLQYIAFSAVILIRLAKVLAEDVERLPSSSSPRQCSQLSYFMSTHLLLLALVEPFCLSPTARRFNSFFVKTDRLE